MILLLPTSHLFALCGDTVLFGFRAYGAFCVHWECIRFIAGFKILGLTYSLHSSSFFGLPYRILDINPKKELLWSLCPKGPCTQTVDILAPRYPNRDYLKAKVSTIWVHGPLGMGIVFMGHIP